MSFFDIVGSLGAGGGGMARALSDIEARKAEEEEAMRRDQQIRDRMTFDTQAASRQRAFQTDLAIQANRRATDLEEMRIQANIDLAKSRTEDEIAAAQALAGVNTATASALAADRLAEAGVLNRGRIDLMREEQAEIERRRAADETRDFRDAWYVREYEDVDGNRDMMRNKIIRDLGGEEFMSQEGSADEVARQLQRASALYEAGRPGVMGQTPVPRDIDLRSLSDVEAQRREEHERDNKGGWFSDTMTPSLMPSGGMSRGFNPIVGPIAPPHVFSDVALEQERITGGARLDAEIKMLDDLTHRTPEQEDRLSLLLKLGGY